MDLLDGKFVSQKILYFVPALHEAGTSIQAITFCKMMQAHGYNIELVIGANKGAFVSDIDNDNLSIFDLSQGRKTGPLRTIKALIYHFRSFDADIVISGAKRTNMLAIIAHKLSHHKSKLIVTLTNDIDQKKSQNDKGRWLSRHLHTVIYKLPDHVIVLSKAMEQKLLSHGFSKDKVSFIPPPINLESIRKRSLEPFTHPWLSEDKSKRDIPVLLAVGRLAKQKNYPELLRSFAILKQSRSVRLLIIGSGKKSYRAALERLAYDLGIQDDIDFLGFVSNPYKYMQASNAFVLSSHWEGFGIVLAEALACDMSIASVDCPDGPREILGEGQYGHLAPLYCDGALNRAMEEALDNPKSRTLIRVKAELYGLKNNAARYQRLFQALERPAIYETIPKTMP